MSDAFVTIIPADPLFVPAPASQRAALAAFSAILVGADEIYFEASDGVRFIDAGANWDGALCPACGADLDEWWPAAMSVASESEFSSLDQTLPCCNTPASLNELKYPWSVGFARWSLVARNPKQHDIADDDLRRLSAILGCDLRIVRSHR